LTGLRFLSALEEEHELKANAIRGFQATELWPLGTQSFQGFLDSNCNGTTTLSPPS
jgi:hypothetical protein